MKKDKLTDYLLNIFLTNHQYYAIFFDNFNTTDNF